MGMGGDRQSWVKTMIDAEMSLVVANFVDMVGSN
jgi:hypothetical protein